MNKLLAKITMITMLASMLIIAPANTQAVAVPFWDVTGTYVWNVLGTYLHDFTISTQNPDGTFSGYAGYPAGGSSYQTTETVTGQVVGNTINFTVVYDGPYNPGYTASMTGTIDSNGHISGTSPWNWQLTGHVAKLNQIPVANAGIDQTITLPTNSVILDGSQSTDDGTKTSYTWTQVSGPSAVDPDDIAMPTINGLVQGVYEFQLIVTDNYGAMSLGDKVIINVNPVVVVPPTSPTNKDQCKKDGWKTFTNSTFKNQGQCVAYTNHQ